MSIDTRAEAAEPVSTAPIITDLRPKSSRRRATLAIIAILAALGFVVARGLGDATLFFLNADEAKAQSVDLGTRRFRLQGIVVDGSVKEAPHTVDFDVEFNGTTVHVSHTGSPPELFRPNIAVVVEGNFAARPTGGVLPVFNSDRILVKHDENYIQKNPNRMKNAADAPS
jgi:cytochrome c-type biogenesis protein CcmE